MSTRTSPRPPSRRRRRGEGSTTSRSSPTTWMRPCASTTAPSAPGWWRRSARRSSSTTSSSSVPSARWRFRVQRPQARAAGEARGHAPSARDPVRPPLVQRARRGGAARPAAPSEERGCEVTDVVDHSIIRSIYFTDPNGIALEASWWVLDTTGRPADYGDSAEFADPDPVPAVRELAESGELSSVPETHLV